MIVRSKINPLWAAFPGALERVLAHPCWVYCMLVHMPLHCTAASGRAALGARICYTFLSSRNLYLLSFQEFWVMLW